MERAELGEPEPRVEEFWDWFAVSLFLLITVDMMTSMYAARRVGLGAEINPLIRWALGQGVVTLVAVHLLVTVVAAGVFANNLMVIIHAQSLL